MLVFFTLIVSILLQMTAAFLAIRLIRVTGNKIAWISIAVAICFMAIRRLITLENFITGDIDATQITAAEIMALVISILTGYWSGGDRFFFSFTTENNR